MTQSTVGRFTVVERLGEGRLGPLYLGRDTAGTAVCLRQLQPRLLASQGARDAVIQAVRRVATLSAPELVRVVDLLESGREWYLVTEHLAGPAVRDLVDRSRSDRLGGFAGDAEAAAALLEDAGRGCLALHAGGVAHGAVGPASLLLGPDGRARLADSGLLSAVTGTPSSAAADAAAWAELARGLRRAWVPARDGAVLDRAADRAEAGDLAAAVGIVAEPPAAMARPALAAAARAWESSRRTARPAAVAPSAGEPAAPSMRATILDLPQGETPSGMTVIEAVPLTGAVEAGIPGLAGGAARGATVFDPSAPPEPARPQATVIDAPEPQGGRSATVLDTPPAATPIRLGTPPASPTGPTPFRLGAVSPPPLALSAEPAAAGVHAGVSGGGQGGRSSSSLLVSPEASSGPREPSWPAARPPAHRAGTRTPILVGAGAAVALVLAIGVVLGLLARGGGSLQVTGVALTMGQATVPCNGTADVRGTVDLNGEAGTVDYIWELSSGASTGGVRHDAVPSGQRQLLVEFRWVLTGSSPGQGTVTLRVEGPQLLAPATATFTYECSG